MEPWVIAAVFLGVIIIGIIVGIQVTFLLGGLAVISAFIFWEDGGLYAVVIGTYGQATNFILLAVPLFIAIGSILQYSGLADDLYDTAHKWLGWLPGGLGVATCFVCAVIAAILGTGTGGVAMVGLIALPAMLKRNYSKSMALGPVGGAGVLGQLIPPSLSFIFYGVLSMTSIGHLFMSGFVPGLLMVLIFSTYIMIRCSLNPKLAPAPIAAERAGWGDRFVSLRGIVLPLALIMLILGVIYTGIATPTEAAGVGVVGALICSLIKRRLNWASIRQIITAAVTLNGMVLWIVMAAVALGAVMIKAGFGIWLQDVFMGFESPLTVIIAMQVMFFILGFFLEPTAILIMLIPLVTPIVEMLGFNLVWFGCLVVINIVIGFITPPFGYGLFVLKQLAPPGTTFGEVARAEIPYVLMMLLVLVLVFVFPQLALWLPATMAK